MIKHYAMIPINRKYVDGKRVVRRVLISYKKRKGNVYTGTKLISKDPYFIDPRASHQYYFADHWFRLVKDEYGDNYLLNVKRPYEYERDNFLDPAIEFEAKTDQEAEKYFLQRGDIEK